MLRGQKLARRIERIEDRYEQLFENKSDRSDKKVPCKDDSKFDRSDKKVPRKDDSKFDRSDKKVPRKDDSKFDRSDKKVPRKDDPKFDHTPNWGIQNGLTVIMDTMSNWNPASVTQDFLGVQAAIKGKNQFPIISRDSFLIRPGHETYIAITATHTSAQGNLRNLPVEKRKCFYDDEFELQLFNTYSVKNCWMESLTNFSRNANPNGCVPWNFPSADAGMPPCKPMERHRFLQAFRSAETNKFVVGGMARCLPNCGGTSYDITVTAAPFRQCDQVSQY
jgi:hypothetical protein